MDEYNYEDNDIKEIRETDNEKKDKAEMTGTVQSEETLHNAPESSYSGQNDPYSKYNYYTAPGSQAPASSAPGFTQYDGSQNTGYQGMPGQAQSDQGTVYQSQPGQAQAYQAQSFTDQGTLDSGSQTQGYQAQTYQNQFYQNQGYQSQSYQNQGYQNQSYAGQGYNPNPYPTGRISYVNNIDSIYPGDAQKKAKKEKSGAGRFFKGLAMSAAFGLVSAGIFCLVLYFYKQNNPEVFSAATKEVQVTTTQSRNDTRLNLDPAEDTKVSSTNIIDTATFTGTDVTDVVSKNMPAIVSINVKSSAYNYFYGVYDKSSAASGIIVEKNDKELMIATNNHVVSGATDIKVNFIDGTSAPATVKGKDTVVDLAVISINLSDISQSTLDAITVAKLGNSDELKVGEMAIAIGNALGYGQSVTVGYISGKDRDLTIDGQKYTGLLQTDAAINPGNSGGALLNIKGEVIGINNAKISGSDVEGMGYAIPISRAQNILGEFMAKETLSSEEQGYMGVIITTVSQDMANMYRWPLGVYVTEVTEGLAADKAGILVGDIITKANGIEVKTHTALGEIIKSTRYGTEITLTVQRRVDGEYKELEIPLILGQRPVEEDSTSDKSSDNESETKQPENNDDIPENLPDETKPDGTDDPSKITRPDGTDGFPGSKQPDGSEGFPGFNQPDGSDSFPGFKQPDGSDSFPGFNQPDGSDSFPGFNQPDGSDGSPEFKQPDGSDGSSDKNSDSDSEGSLTPLDPDSDSFDILY